MPGEAINLANILTRIQFAQDTYAIFQATDQSAREELSARQKVRAVVAEREVQESEHVEGKMVHKIDEDQQRGQNFDDMLDEARKRLQKHKHAREEEGFETSEDGHSVDIII